MSLYKIGAVIDYVYAYAGRRMLHTAMRKGLVLGVYRENKQIELTPSASTFQSKQCDQLTRLINLSGFTEEQGNVKVFYGVDSSYTGVAVTSLGKASAAYNEQEEIDEKRENIRVAVCAAVKALQSDGVNEIDIDPCGDAEAAAEGAILSTYKYDDLKSEKKPPPRFNCLTDFCEDAEAVRSRWERGVILAEGQNFSHFLMEAPANVMTPTRFGAEVTERIGGLDNCTVHVRDRAWAESMKMGSYLSVANGSAEPPKFVEVQYKGGKEGEAPLALVGKGITFDSGGISIKPSAGMDDMRADMGGGACVVASIYTAARLKLPINIHGFVPLTENMPGGRATKPGDVVTAMNGKTIQINNTDAEGRLVLADALLYAQTFKPRAIVDMATLTGAICVALGATCSGVFSNSTSMFQKMHKAGTISGDRVWRMPLFKYYNKRMRDAALLADINNVNTNRYGGSCTAAGFLSEFVEHDSWMHMDIASVMENKTDVPYLCEGMTGRPTRTVVEFINLLCQENA